eukprot:6916014-Prorocentrum_lima.AAC.1
MRISNDAQVPPPLPISTEKPYPCSWCAYRAASIGVLCRHQREVHGQYKYAEMWISTLTCPICEKQFETRQKVLRHVLYDASVCKRVMQ